MLFSQINSRTLNAGLPKWDVMKLNDNGQPVRVGITLAISKVQADVKARRIYRNDNVWCEEHAEQREVA
jgi:hypothetical protein